ncbi:50S ribosomal protein L27 [Octopus sinensis]|uniref:50S ribosomal protein L27 n=1 Tax=Octopus sinensis TaxID=2607531 RepID=A0A6P7SLA3_9MOLL|nr:50S ribosomal protein L27 [Octopus sinensis]
MANLLGFSRLMTGVSRQIGLSDSIAVRWASKKAGSNTRNKVGSTPGKSRGLKKKEGSFIHKGEVIFTQLGLRYYPGENVGLLRDKTLVALCDGKVMISHEYLDPFPDSPLYEPVKKGVLIRKKFFHVIPVPLHAKFRLVSQI